VKVGSITGARAEGGNARLTLTIHRHQLPQVHRDARVVLEPITPLKDMQLLLDPGAPPAPVLHGGATIPIANATTPVPLSALLSALDSDTRAFVASMLASMGEGLDGRGLDLRKALRAFGPTTAQAHRITSELAGRRRDLAALVTNVRRVTEAASRDERLTTVVQAGERTLRAIAVQDDPLRIALDRLPSALRTTRATLHDAARFATRLEPAVSALTPPIRRLPAALRAFKPLGDEATVALRSTIRPAVRELRPLVASANAATKGLVPLVPDIVQVADNAVYALRELAYNPPGNDEGILFWLSFAAHNANSVYSSEDAHGGIGRSIVLVNCSSLGITGIAPILKALTGSADLCPDKALG
jgi:phospholipid/cholesterol/gamma-HCH transport system substrate-binding protein